MAEIVWIPVLGHGTRHYQQLDITGLIWNSRLDLRLLARKGAKAQIRFTGPAWAQLRDAVTEVVGATGIAARCDHVEQPRGGQGGEAFQRLGDERP